jgi:competence protein ComEC
MMTSVIAGAATAPFAIYHFQHVAAFGLVANMIAVPLAAFWVIPAGLIALVLYPVGWELRANAPDEPRHLTYT